MSTRLLQSLNAVSMNARQAEYDVDKSAVVAGCTEPQIDSALCKGSTRNAGADPGPKDVRGAGRR